MFGAKLMFVLMLQVADPPPPPSVTVPVPLPDRAVTQARLDELQARLEDVKHLMADVRLVSDDLQWARQITGKRFSYTDSFRPNYLLLTARAAALWRMHEPLSDALDARLALDRVVRQYNRWLDSRPTPHPPDDDATASPAAETRRLGDRYKVLTHLHALTLHRGAAKIKDPAEAAALQRKAEELEQFVGDYTEIADRNKYESEYEYLTEAQAAAEARKLKREIARKPATPPGGAPPAATPRQPTNEVELSAEQQETLAAARTLLEDSAFLPALAMCLVENAIHAAKVINNIENIQARNIEDRTRELRRLTPEDKQHLEQLRKICGVTPAPEADTDPWDVKSLGIPGGLP